MPKPKMRVRERGCVNFKNEEEFRSKELLEIRKAELLKRMKTKNGLTQ